MILVATPLVEVPDEEAARALIREARRLRRRRWRQGGATVVALLAAFGAAASFVGGTRPDRHVHPGPTPSALIGPSRTLAGGPSPELPQALAVGPHGTLYMADEGREQILRVGRTGKARIVAGDGKPGDVGDGGPALAAQLSLAHDSGLAVSPTGEIAITDPAHGRVRAVEPSGTIRTLVGGGSTIVGGRTRPIPAKSARFIPLDEPSGLAFGPGGSLYISTDFGLFRLGADHALHWVLGPTMVRVTTEHGHDSVSTAGSSLEPVPGPGAIVEARDGHLLVAAAEAPYPDPQDHKGLYEIRAHGQLRLVTPLSKTPWNAAAPDPSGGAVVAIDGRGLERVRANGHRSSLLPTGLTEAVRQHIVDFGGVAIGPGGDTYVDTYTWAGPRLVVAILRISPSRAVHVLWRS